MNYSVLDQWMHRIAFGAPDLQQNLAAIEDKVHGKSLRDIELLPPVFITGLPRAGTTILLETLAKLPAVATHRYSDMPFIMAPALWKGVSGRFRKKVPAQMRAHGDGITIDTDSPEAFEEILWLEHWSEHYSQTGIRTWADDPVDAEFREKLQNHMRKLILARGLKRAHYISKNNANIARIDFIAKTFPDAGIVVPFRHPVEHAKSLLRQHVNFLEMHGKDPFSKRYMADIGHLEFGRLHRPLLFPDVEERLRQFANTDLEYWLTYWILAYRAVLESSGKVVLVSLDSLRSDPLAVLSRLSARLGLSDTDELVQAARGITPTKPDSALPSDSALAAEAHELYSEMEKLSEVQLAAGF